MSYNNSNASEPLPTDIIKVPTSRSIIDQQRQSSIQQVVLKVREDVDHLQDELQRHMICAKLYEDVMKFRNDAGDD